jgi:hypothetical protein
MNSKGKQLVAKDIEERRDFSRVEGRRQSHRKFSGQRKGKTVM